MRRGWVWVLCGFFVILRSDSVAGRRVMCKEEEEVFSFGMIRLPRLAARCRGGSRRRRRSGRVWDLACIRFGCKKPHTSSIRCRGLRSSASDRSFAFGSARPSFLLSPPLNMYWVGWGGAQAFPRERITPSVLSNCRSPIPPGISSRGSHLGGRAARTARAGFGVIL